MKNVTYISAGAGSGKTYTLTHTMADLIKDGKVKPEEVILTTFTTRAANEFREKAKACLYEYGMYDKAARLDQALIGTIHSVCQQMIGKYWFIVGLTPDMNVMTDEDADFYISQSLASLPTDKELKLLHNFVRTFNIREVVNNRVMGYDYNFWKNELSKIIGFTTNYEIEDYTKSIKESLEFAYQFVKPGSDFSFTASELKAVLDEHQVFLNSQKQSKANDERIEKLEALYFGYKDPNIAWYSSLREIICGLSKSGPLAADFVVKTNGIWNSNLVYKTIEGYVRLMFDLAKRWNEQFSAFKRQKNLLDFNDMEKYMRKLLQNKDITEDIKGSYKYLFVDEYQDSSPIQVKIFDALSELMEHSYWVGDYKQAIYGFRGSDTALTKAIVDRISEKKDGCDTTTIDISHRSLPDIVDVCNKVFGKTFAHILKKGDIELYKKRTNDNGETSLRYFMAQDNMTVAAYVADQVMNKGVKPKDIAVLAFSNTELENVGWGLNQYNIPVSREDNPVVGSRTCMLVESLLAIVSSDKNTLAKAKVAYLAAQGYSVKKIIEDKLLFDNTDGKSISDYMLNVPIIKRLMMIRKSLQQQSLSAMVESMIIELDLYKMVMAIEDDAAFGASCLDAIIVAAKAYEQSAIQLNLPATIEGFIDYLESSSLTGKGDPDGVQLVTYHSSKGLQWPQVVMLSLNYSPANEKTTIEREIYGIHADHTEQPTADNPYPDVFIRVTPYVYGTRKKLPDDINQQITNGPLFKRMLKSRTEEWNRLLYVGMTRAENVLTLGVEKGPWNTPPTLQWFKDVGITNVLRGAAVSGQWDILGIGTDFTDYTLDNTVIADMLKRADDNVEIPMALKKDDMKIVDIEPRFVSPSNIHYKGKVISTENLDHRIPLGNLGDRPMSDVGDCIHQIYAGIEVGLKPADTVASYGMQAILPDSDAIVTAWNNLTAWLEKTFGNAVKTYHERPFRMEKDGQLFTGSIDLVWQTNEGDILIDFKTCPMGPSAVLDEKSTHYAGWYAGQLDCYTQALTQAGDMVLRRFIYYPVSGILAEI